MDYKPMIFIVVKNTLFLSWHIILLCKGLNNYVDNHVILKSFQTFYKWKNSKNTNLQYFTNAFEYLIFMRFNQISSTCFPDILKSISHKTIKKSQCWYSFWHKTIQIQASYNWFDSYLTWLLSSFIAKIVKKNVRGVNRVLWCK
jgi:hypothetical protein